MFGPVVLMADEPIPPATDDAAEPGLATWLAEAEDSDSSVLTATEAFEEVVELFVVGDGLTFVEPGGHRGDTVGSGMGRVGGIVVRDSPGCDFSRGLASLRGFTGFVSPVFASVLFATPFELGATAAAVEAVVTAVPAAGVD